MKLWVDPLSWDAAVSATMRAPFLQSWGWGLFQEAIGRRVFRLGAVQGNRIAAGCQVITMSLPLGRQYLYLPRGPFGDPPTFPWEEAVAFLRKQVPQAVFLRVDFGERSGVMPPGAARSPAALQPRDTLVIDLRHSEDELLAAMHEKTRYNIRLAQRKGVTVTATTDPAALEAFFPLLVETARREGITAHPSGYYRRLFEILAPRGMAALWIAMHERETIVANLVVSFGDTVTYLHGASSGRHRSLMAPHLTQWEQLRDAKARGCRRYDFWGVAPPGAAATHRWAGITRFKEGFGGQRISYPQSIDLPLQALPYRAYRLARAILRRTS